MTDSQPDTGAEGLQPLDPAQLEAYFVLMEAVSLLQHQVEQQLRAEGGISYVQFQLLARLADAHGPLTMTQLADGVVYSRSGLTYQAALLEKAGLITRTPSPDDERHLGDIMTRVRDHMRPQPPRSAAPRKRRSTSPPRNEQRLEPESRPDK